jgi:hypothetical protein
MRFTSDPKICDFLFLREVTERKLKRQGELVDVCLSFVDARQWLGRQEDGASCGVFFSTSSNIALLCLSRIIFKCIYLEIFHKSRLVRTWKLLSEQSKIEGKYKSI